MLTQLRISNFAIIEEQIIEFEPGFNVISGETGSGKSVVLNALEVILGARPKPNSVRAGAEGAEIEAHLDLTRLPRETLEELPEIARTDELVLSRSISKEGRSKVFINGRLGTVSMLEEIASRVINLCGQNQQVRLLEPAYHRDLIDGYAGLGSLREDYRDLYEAWKTTGERLRAYEEDRGAWSERRAAREQTYEELKSLNPAAGLRQQLEIEVRRLAGGEKLTAGAQRLEELLEGEDGLSERLVKVKAEIHDLVRIDERWEEIETAIETAESSIEDAARQLRFRASRIELDEETAEQLRSRLNDLARLERKYKRDDAGLAELLAQTERELAADGGLEDPGPKLREAFEALERKIRPIADKLTTERKRAAKRLAKEAAAELKELNMVGVELGARIEGAPYGPAGADSIELLIATNPGEPQKPLRQVASGGELSRITLVLKKLLRDRSGVNVLVFDEVDTGISGGVARAVGEKLRSLSRDSQVICITHLAQVASLADRHLQVDKVVGARTLSIVRELRGEEQVEEIARMLAGYRVTNAARESARELLKNTEH